MKGSKIDIILTTLRQLYPEKKTDLVWRNPWELLVATILSAQSSDKQVNKVLPLVFKRWPTPKKMSHADLKEVEKIIKSIGLYKTKAKYLIETAKILCEKFNCQVPDNMKDLLSLYGVSRKTANIVLSLGFKRNEGIAVDTHVKRIARRLGFTKHTDPKKVERDLMQLIPKKSWGEINLLLVQFGREICRAKSPKCNTCPLNNKRICFYAAEHN